MDDPISSFLNEQLAEISILEQSPANLPPGVLLRIRGTALIDGAKSGNNRLYTKGFNDKCLEETKRFMSLGGTVSMFSRHGKAVQVGALATGLPTGHVVDLFREDNKIRYEAYVADTTEGRDVATLLRVGSMRASSIRLRAGATSRKVRIEGQVFDELTYGIIKGVDLADEAGIPGAGVEEILEEYQIQVLDVGDDDMTVDWSKITLEELKTNVPQVLQDYVASYLEANPPKPQTADADGSELATLKQEVETLKAQVIEEQDKVASVAEAKDTELATLAYENALLSASQIGVGKAIYAELKAKAPKVEDIPAVLESVRSAALNTYIQKATPDPKNSSFKGVSQDVVDSDAQDSNKSHAIDAGITEELQEDVLRLSARRSRV